MIRRAPPIPARRVAAGAVAAILALAATGALATPRRDAPAETVQTGIASWYGPRHDGKPTASGEPFDMYDFTAAHPSFTFGTLVKVTLLATGRSVVVRVNDRFPRHRGRVIDLSRAAAREIGMMRRGTGRVRIEVVERTASADR